MINILITWRVEKRRVDWLKHYLGRSVKIFSPSNGNLEELISLAREADIMIGGRIPDAALEASRRLKFIQLIRAGINGVNLKIIREKGVLIANNGGANAIAVAEHAMMFILALTKRLIEMNKAVKEGRWIPYTPENMLDDLEGKKIGVIGLGKIGRELVKRAKAFDMKVLAIKKHVYPKLKGGLGIDFLGGPGDLKYVLKESDYVVVTLPLTAETEGLIGEEELKAMKPTAYLINVSRARVVDEKALFKALKNKWIAGAGLDVWYTRHKDPNYPSKLKIHGFENVIATPHKAGFTKLSLEKSWFFAAKNIKRFIEGKKPESLVDVKLGY